MAWNPNVPTVTNRVQDDLNAIRENFQHLDPLAPYVQALLDSRIVEMGSNSNGGYVRWENGLQVCWHQLSFAFTSGGTNNLLVTWVFPAAFANTNYRMIGVSFTANPTRYIFANSGGKTTSSVNARMERPSDTGNVTVPAEVLAIGRWK